MSITNFCISLVLFLFFSINSNTTRITTIITKKILVILNTDIPATRPVDPVCESLDEEMSDGVEQVVDDGVELVVDDGVEQVVDDGDELVVDDGVELVVELSIVIIIVTGGDLSLSYSTLLIVKTPYT